MNATADTAKPLFSLAAYPHLLALYVGDMDYRVNAEMLRMELIALVNALRAGEVS